MAARLILVHGGFRGAWCREHTIPEPGRRGHQSAPTHPGG
jgi:hypothetical protein